LAETFLKPPSSDNRRPWGWVVGLLLLVVSPSSAADEHPVWGNRRAAAHLEKGELDAAESALQKARFADPGNPRVSANLGTILYRKRDFVGAARAFERAADRADDEKLRAGAYHNLGNAHFRSGSFSEAVAAYQRSLALLEDAQTRFNLEVAQKRLQEQMTPPPNQDGSPSADAEKSSQNQQGKDQQHDPQGQGQKDPKSGQDQSQNGTPKDGQPGDGQKNQGQEGQKGQNQDVNQKESSGSEKEASPGETDSSQEKTSQDPSTPGEKSPEDQPSASASAELGEDPPADLQDVEPPTEARDGASPPPPEASQRARGMKNQAINPYRLEQILRQLEERENDLQLRYRREPKREDEEEMDPFFMDSRQLRDFFEGRRRPQRAPSEQPDW
jgi:Ca-activated chloride channel homolog